MVALFVAALAAPPSAPAAGFLFPSMGAAGNFAVFGLYNASAYTITENGATIKGNEGISQNGVITINSPTTVTGSLYQYQANQYTAPYGALATLNSTLMGTGAGSANGDFTAALGLINGDSCTMCTQGALSAGTTKNGTGGLNVIDFSSVTLNGANLTLQGNSTDYFIVRVSGNLSLAGTASIVLTGVAASHVILDVAGNISTTGATNQLSGYIIAETGTMSFSTGTAINGELIAKNNITLASGTTVNGFTPEPSTLFLIGGALIAIGTVSKRLRRG